MYSEKGLAALGRERLRKDVTELTLVFPPQRVPSCLVLKGTGRTFLKNTLIHYIV